jgi:hypothetical protein
LVLGDEGCVGGVEELVQGCVGCGSGLGGGPFGFEV